MGKPQTYTHTRIHTLTHANTHGLTNIQFIACLPSHLSHRSRALTTCTHAADDITAAEDEELSPSRLSEFEARVLSNVRVHLDLIHLCMCVCTPSRAHRRSPIHSLNHSLTRSLTHSHPLTHTRSHTPLHTLLHTLTHSNTHTIVPNSPSRLLLLAPVVTSTTTLNPMSDVRQMSPTSQSRDGSTDDASPESTRFFEIGRIQSNAFEYLAHNVCV